MKPLWLCLCLLLLPALAQAQDEAPADDASAAKTDTQKHKAVKPPAEAPPAESVDAPPAPALGAMEDMPYAELQALDKITARVSHIESKIGDVETFGSLNMVVKACRKAPPENTPESAAFIQVWEQKPGEETHWVYSGWMFASSPALTAMDHPVYDIWLTDCKNEPTKTDSSKPQ